MNTQNITRLLSALLMLFLFACDKDKEGAQRQMKLQSVGFTGTLPNNWKFGTTGIVAWNGVGGGSSTNDGSYIRHDFAVTDTVSKYNIMLDLPQMKYSNDYITRNDLKPVARQYYSYNTVKEKLSVGNKLLYSKQSPDITKSFRIQIADNINYISFLADSYHDQTGSYLKVTDLIEGTEPDPVLGQVKTIEVIFDLDIKMYPAQGPSPASPPKLKGFLRMKYREI